ncbi:MAG TPA: TA system VapC family ribonuclease toxin [Opitutaceae bacterium]
MKGYLLDVNVLIALAWPNHPQHATAHGWFGREHSEGWGTCMVTQIGFVRVSSHAAVEHHVSTQEAWRQLSEIASLPTHSFWSEPPDGCRNEVFLRTLPSILTHGGVTDGYLATVAAFHGGKLATFDRQLARTFGPLAVLVGRAA